MKKDFDKYGWEPWDEYVSWGADPRTVAAQVKKVIKWGGNVNARGKDNITPLVLLAAYGYLAAVKALVNAGAKINDTNFYGENAVIAAATADRVPVVNYLADAGASLDEVDECDLSAMERATGRHKRKITGILIKHGATPNMYVTACEEYEYAS